jgi:transposase
MKEILALNASSPTIAKDASRAVRRLDNLTRQPVTTQMLSDLLGLSGIEVIEYGIEEEGQQKYLHLFCEHTQDVALCRHCCQIAESGYDHKDRCVRHLDIWGMSTFVHFSQRRFDCEVCGKPFSENLSWIDPKRRHTKAYEAYIYQRIQKTARKHVALEEGLSESTVSDIFKKYAKEHISTKESEGDKKK